MDFMAHEVLRTMAGESERKALEASQRRARRRANVFRWHWVSAAVCLVGILFFAGTGITLSHADYFESQTTAVTRYSDVLPHAVLLTLADEGVLVGSEKRPLPVELRNWVRARWGLGLLARDGAQWRTDEVFVALARPGVEAWMSIDRRSGAIRYESDDHGWVAYFNDLHRGKNAGSAWVWLTTALALGGVVCAVSGLLLLAMHAKARWLTWPLTGLGVLLPGLLILLFMH